VRLIIVDFDKTLTLIDSSLLFAIEFFLVHPGLIFEYIYLAAFGGGREKQIFKERVERLFRKRGGGRLLNLNSRRRVLEFVLAAKEKGAEVMLLSGAHSDVINKYLCVWGVVASNYLIFGRDKFDNLPCCLVEAKLQKLRHWGKLEQFRSVIHINDNMEELVVLNERLLNKARLIYVA
jgi:hypothetical protein